MIEGRSSDAFEHLAPLAGRAIAYAGKVERCRPGQASIASADPGPICGRPPWHKSFLVGSDRLHPYVRPVECDRVDRWPRWFARCEFQTATRPVDGRWVPRTVSHRCSIDR